MVSNRIPDPATRAFATTVASLQSDVDMLKRAQRSAQLGNSSIDDGALLIRKNGVVTGSVGLQPDGSFAVSSMNAGTPPGKPTTPILTAIASGLIARWDGKLVGTPTLPSNFKLIEIYVGTTASFVPGPSTFVGTLQIAGDYPVAPLTSSSIYYVRFIAVNNAETQSGVGARITASPVSDVASVQPSMVVAQSVLDGIVTTLALADNAVSAAKLAVNSVGTANIQGNAVTLSQLADNSVNAAKLITDSVTIPKIVSGAVTAPKIAPVAVTAPTLAGAAVTGPAIAASAVTANSIAANSIVAGKIAANVVTATELSANSVTASQISANAVTAGKISAESITANEIASNAVSTNELNAASVVAGKVAANAIGANELAANSVVAGKLAADSVTTSNLVAGSVQATDIAASAISATAIAAGAVTTGKLAALAVTANEIAANAINTGHIQAGAVTAAKLAAILVITNTLIAGTETGSRVVLNSGGIEAYRPNGTTKTLDFDNATGNLLIAGQYRSGDSGERVIINTDGTQVFTNSGGGTSGVIANNGNDLLLSGTPGGSSRTGVLNVNSTSSGITYRSPSSSTVYGEVNVQYGIVQNNAAIVYMHADQRVPPGNGTQRVQFSTLNSGGGEYASSVLNYVAAAQKASFLNPVENVGIKFEVGQISVVNGAATAFAPIKATQFIPSSSETVKENIGEIAIPNGRTSWDLIEGAPAQDWDYISEKQNILARPVDEQGNITQVRVRNPALTNDEFDNMLDYDPDKWVTIRATFSPDEQAKRSTRRRHKFPLAEDLYAVCPDLVDGDINDPENLGADLRDVVGILWDAMDMMIKRERLLEAILVQRFPVLATALPGRPQKGDVKSGIGAIIAGRTKRDIDTTTGQIRNRIKSALASQ